MKRIELRTLRQALENLTFSEFSDSIAAVLLDNLTAIVSIDDELTKIVEIAQKAFFTEEYKEASKKYEESAQKYNSAPEAERQELYAEVTEAEKALRESCKGWFDKYQNFIVLKQNEEVKVSLKKFTNKEKFQQQLLAFAKSYKDKHITASMLMPFNALIEDASVPAALDEKAILNEIETFKNESNVGKS